MSQHPEHQMQLTSLLCKWPTYNEEQYNFRFRQAVERKIIRLHLEHPEGLTDEELLNLFGNPDTNLVRPRRCDLSKERKNRPSIIFDSGKKKKNRWDRLCIIWQLNPQNLTTYLS